MVFVLHLKATYPYACFCGENKKVDGFLINELSMKPSFICKDPNLLMLSSEKIVALRCLVLQLLILKNLIKGDVSLVNMFRIN
ncbi:hypothetical protein CISIN_1g037820mg [Citrus sinensis]|uniref:Uncharacterized protein n=1 Tax=Citrus sinensis TaxID=2711 RepID=A0A067EBN7_CITSI|nr:hypothetical protein CISIN_1g037820mg [Citrus sinensis]